MIWSVQVTRIIKLIWVPTLVTFGTILNLLTIMVFCRRRMCRYCLSISMICLAIADTAILLGPVLLSWIDETFFEYYYLHHTIWCNLHGYVDLVSCANSSWIIILISTERWFAVCKPWQKNKIFTTFTVKIILFIIFITSTLLFSYFPIIVGRIKNECHIEHQQIYFIFGTLSVILVYFLPFFILAFLNAMIIVRLRHRPFQKKFMTVKKFPVSKKSPDTVNKNNSTNEIPMLDETPQTFNLSAVPINSSNDQNLSITLVTLAITFMILTFPFQTHWFYENIYSIWSKRAAAAVGDQNLIPLSTVTQNPIGVITDLISPYPVNRTTTTTLIHENSSNTSSLSSSTMTITIGDVTFMIKNMNYLINFFLYSALSKLFRQEFLTMISADEYLNKFSKWTRSFLQEKSSSSLAELSFSAEAFKNLKNGDYRKSKQKLFLVKLEPSNFFEYFRSSKNRKTDSPVITNKFPKHIQTTAMLTAAESSPCPTSSPFSEIQVVKPCSDDFVIADDGAPYLSEYFVNKAEGCVLKNDELCKLTNHSDVSSENKKFNKYKEKSCQTKLELLTKKSKNRKDLKLSKDLQNQKKIKS